MHARTRIALLGALGVLSVGPAAQAQTPASNVAQPVTTTAPRRDGLITPADIKAWNSIRQTVLSTDGRWFAYVVSPNEGDATVVWRGTASGANETRVTVGDGGGSLAISGDSKWLGYIIAPPRAQPGRGRNAAREDGDSARTPAAPASNTFVLVNLATGEKKEFERIRRFAFNADRPRWVALTGYGTPETPPAGSRPAATGGGPGAGGNAPGGNVGPNAPAPLLLYNLGSGELFNMGIVGEYEFDENGEWLAYTMSTPDRVGNGVQLRNMRTNVVRSIDSERMVYRHLAWVDSARALSVMRGLVEDGDTIFSIVAFRRFGPNGPAQRNVFDPSKVSGFPNGWKLASERAPRYSRDMSTVFFGIREEDAVTTRPRGAVQPGAPGMGGRVNEGTPPTDSLPSLILWHGKDSRLQSQQIVQEQNDRAFNYLSSYRFADDRFVRLADDELRNVTLTNGERYAYGTDVRPYERQASVNGRNYQDVYAVDLATGQRRLLMKQRPSTAMVGSPDGRKVLYWGTNGQWWTLDLVTGDTVDITTGAPVSFVNENSDHNNLYPPAGRQLGWSRDNQYVLLDDGWDVWRVPARANGGSAAVNLTGDGRTSQVRYQRLYNFPTRGSTQVPGGFGFGGGNADGVDLSKPLYFGLYGEWTKQEGLARVDANRPGAQRIFLEDARFNVTKARDADVFAYTRQTFTEYPNWWIASAGFRDGHRITDVNPQMRDLAWSSGTRLIDYTSDRGVRLQAAMYLPANFDPSRQYPMLVTIYEKRSQNLHGFVSPSETRAPDPSQYTNRGYIVLDPDIVYHVNDPGMSAVWSVIPAVRAAIATGSVDSTKIGLWGHSWGGYQTAFLVTQTNLFAGAIAGAPLTDMVSMYSSVYWNSGGTNQAIFESSQGRFKGNFIENYDAYLRNSPNQHADNVTTPLMILHNDKDGAVDFNQGITYFNTLRQLGKDVILLEYVGENHGLARAPNQRDYAQRMTEYFDHYVRGLPAADWIRDGVPRIRMEEHLKSRLAPKPNIISMSGND